MSTGKVVSGVLAGAAVGAIVGVLFAPASGAATRRMIYRKGENQLDSLKGKFNEFVDNVSEKFSTTKDTVEEMVDTGKTQMGKEGGMDQTFNKKI